MITCLLVSSVHYPLFLILLMPHQPSLLVYFKRDRQDTHVESKYKCFFIPGSSEWYRERGRERISEQGTFPCKCEHKPYMSFIYTKRTNMALHIFVYDGSGTTWTVDFDTQHVVEYSSKYGTRISLSVPCNKHSSQQSVMSLSISYEISLKTSHCSWL